MGKSGQTGQDNHNIDPHCTQNTADMEIYAPARPVAGFLTLHPIMGAGEHMLMARSCDKKFNSIVIDFRNQRTANEII